MAPRYTRGLHEFFRLWSVLDKGAWLCFESKEGVASPPAFRTTNMPVPRDSTETLRMTGNPLPEAPRGRLSREHSMKRRQLLKAAAAVPFLSSAELLELADARAS